MKDRFVCIAGKVFMYHYPITIGHKELMRFFSSGTVNIDLEIIPLSELNAVDSDKLVKVYELENITIYKHNMKKKYYVFMNQHMFAEYDLNKKTIYVKCNDQNNMLPYALPLPVEDFLFTDVLSRCNNIIVHGGAAKYDNTLLLYYGRSGAGKSTISSLLEKCGFTVFSDERIVISCASNQVYSAYWVSSNGSINNLSAYTDHIIHLEHSINQANCLDCVSSNTMFASLIKEVFYPIWDKELSMSIIIKVKTFLESVRCYNYRFVPKECAVEVLYDEIKRIKE